MINSYWGEFEIFNIAVRKSRPNINIASILFVWQTVKTTKESWHGQYFQVNYYSNPSLGHTLPVWLKSFTSSYLQGIIVFCMLIISAIVTGLGWWSAVVERVWNYWENDESKYRLLNVGQQWLGGRVCCTFLRALVGSLTHLAHTILLFTLKGLSR